MVYIYIYIYLYVLTKFIYNLHLVAHFVRPPLRGPSAHGPAAHARASRVLPVGDRTIVRSTILEEILSENNSLI